MPLSQITTSRYAVPVGAIVALGVAVGVWVVPSSLLDPRTPDMREVGGAIPKAPEIAGQDVPDRAAWMGVAARLDSLRKPDPEALAEEEEEEDEEEQIDAGGDTPPPVRPAIQLSWEYEGLVAQPDRVAALIRIAGTQRFVFEGSTLDSGDDPTLRPNMTVVISKVERDRLTISIDGAEQVIERSDDAVPVRAPGQKQPDARRRS